MTCGCMVCANHKECHFVSGSVRQGACHGSLCLGESFGLVLWLLLSQPPCRETKPAQASVACLVSSFALPGVIYRDLPRPVFRVGPISGLTWPGLCSCVPCRTCDQALSHTHQMNLTSVATCALCTYVTGEGWNLLITHPPTQPPSRLQASSCRPLTLQRLLCCRQ